ncbi:hypothetical protein [Actinocorallia sp. A-T 12471]|uniref:hypothetical protein n=1 Tax=Actinocorallia sp. A-T 12471 TaxID=3089813 RepID=UPI0029D148CC|nr:hypothetical protein [Actinocorallia sp. A-T 12471]MDX6743324.1 hypothetical protein [Actinocorallia sp. A-T 12471]
MSRSSGSQSGPRDLWDEAERVVAQWARLGRPGRDRYRMRVTPDGQRLERVGT